MANIGDVPLTPQERTITRMAISRYAQEGPDATEENLDFFRVPFAMKCLSLAIRNNVLTDTGMALAKRALSTLEAH